MKVLAIVMLVLAILLGAVGGAVYGLCWWVVPENTEFVALFTEQNIFKDGRELRPAENMAEMVETYSLNKVAIIAFAAAALLIVLAIVVFVVASARKKAQKKKAARAFEAEEAPVAIPVAATPVVAAPTLAPAQTKSAVALSDDKKELLKKVAPFAIAGAAVIAVVVLMKRSKR